MRSPLSFTARIIPGAGRGKTLGTPTFNLALEEIPGTLTDGVYAVYASVEESTPLKAVMHFGSRPTFDGSRSCEVHLLRVTPSSPELVEGRIEGPNPKSQIPSVLTVEVLERLRDVKRFKTPKALKEQIVSDIAQAKVLFTEGARP